MMYKLLILLVLGLITQAGYSQQIIWEKQFGGVGDQEIKAVCEGNNGSLFAIGFNTRWGMYSPSFGSVFGSVLIKLNSIGDTLFTRRLNLFCQSWGTPYIGRFWNGNYLAVVNVEMPVSSSSLARYPSVIEIDEQGEIVNLKLFPQHRFRIITGAKSTRDGGLILSGYKGSLDVFHTDSMFAMKVNFLLEEEWAFTYPNVANAYFRGEHLEPMANGNFLVSGTLGSRIYGMEVDSNGTLVHEKIFYQTPSNRVFIRSQIHQMWRKYYLGYGTYSPALNTYRMALVLMDSTGQKIWGGEKEGNNGPLYVNRELSFVFNSFEGTMNYLTRIGIDSTIHWKIAIGNNALLSKSTHALIFTQNDTGIIVGTQWLPTGNLNNQFWIAKIAGVGTAYDPTNPDDTVNVSVEERMFRPKDAPVLYPNPATETLHFQKLTGATRVGIYSMLGQKVRESRIEPEQPLDICDLPPGAYLYHLNMGERVFTGKFWKR